MTDKIVITVAALEHFEYCQRQCALIHVDGVWVDNEHTERGHAGHRRVDDIALSRLERGRRVLRGVALWSEVHGLSGRADVIEITDDNSIIPVEYKIGTRHGAAADIQLCAQALCLEEMFGVDILHGYLWLSAVRRKQRVVIDEALRERTIAAIESVRAQFMAPHLPAAVNDERCSQCQLYAHCLPGVVARPTELEWYVAHQVLQCN